MKSDEKFKTGSPKSNGKLKTKTHTKTITAV